MSENENDNEKLSRTPAGQGPIPRDPAVSLDAHRGLRARHDTDARRHRSAVRADQDAVRESRASLEKHLFAGPAGDWPEAAEKIRYLLRLFAATGEAQDPRYKLLIEETLDDLERLGGDPQEPAP